MINRSQIISADQFKAIHEVIYSAMVALNIDPTARDARCMFNFIASYLLLEHHQIFTVPEVGTAYFTLDNHHTISGFDYQNDRNSYHSWVSFNDIIIDFTSPLYDQFVIKHQNDTIPSKMFQKSLNSMSNSIYDMKNKGDYHLFEFAHLVMVPISSLFTYPDYQLLVKACRAWYDSDPANIPNSFTLQICCKRQLVINKINVTLNGAW